jgi:hypothetical protein
MIYPVASPVVPSTRPSRFQLVLVDIIGILLCDHFLEDGRDVLFLLLIYLQNWGATDLDGVRSP